MTLQWAHRQPKAGEAPQERELTPAEKKQKELDQALEKKLADRNFVTEGMETWRNAWPLTPRRLSAWQEPFQKCL